ncbi:MAG: GNAT family N-acetyltransferase [Eubacteriaceae bacterium]|jgi:GNAT superfamily N-acetyltransferase|nr:GNAT family N-acetyltransferase [Eubacteriaceae bacterium]
MLKLPFIKNQHTLRTQTVLLRKVDIHTVDEILQLQEKVVSSLTDSDLFVPFERKDLLALFACEDNLLLGVFDEDGELIAFRAASVCGDDFDEVLPYLDEQYHAVPKMLLAGAFVDPAYRSNRLQRKMIEYTLTWAYARGIKLFFTLIHPDNAASLKSVTSLGFEPYRHLIIYTHNHDRLLLVKMFP